MSDGEVKHTMKQHTIQPQSDCYCQLPEAKCRSSSNPDFVASIAVQSPDCSLRLRHAGQPAVHSWGWYLTRKTGPVRRALNHEVLNYFRDAVLKRTAYAACHENGPIRQ
jgi:hypothetical protein